MEYWDYLAVDDREPRPTTAHPRMPDIVPLIRAEDVRAKRERLEVGDYQMFDADNELVLVTRKASDLLDSTFSGHFGDELRSCVNAVHSYGGGKVFFLYEGPWATVPGGWAHFKKSGTWFRAGSTHGGAESLLAGIQLSLQVAGVFVVYTSSIQESAVALASIYKKGKAGWPTRLTSRMKRPELKWSDDSKVQRLMALWPNLREGVAISLLARYTTIAAVLEAAQTRPKEVLQTEGLGAQGLSNLLGVLQ